MNNFKTLLIQEFLNQVKSFKFLLMVALTLIVTVFTSYVQIIDFKERYQNYQAEALKASQEAKEARTFAELHVPVILPPNPLSVFSKGFDEKAGNKIVISVEDLPELETVSQKKNTFMAIFMNFDIVNIVKIILSLMAIYLIADTISGEREEETLKMVFMNSITRLEFFLAKYVAVLVVMVIPLLGIFLFSSLFISLQPLIQLTTMQWLRIFLIFLSSLGFLSIFILIGLWISVQSYSSSLSMILGLLVWIITVFIYPTMVNYVTGEIVTVPSTDEINNQINMVKQEFGKELIDDYKEYYPHGRLYTAYDIPSSKYSYLDEKGWTISLPVWNGPTSKFRMEFFEGQIKRMIPILFSYQNEMMDMYDSYRQKLLKQKRVASFLQILMPGYLFEESGAYLANTSYKARVLGLLQNARDYRNKFIEYIKTKDGFSAKYFTQIPKDLWTDDSKTLLEDPVYDIYKFDIKSNKLRLNLNDIPQIEISYPFLMFNEIYLILLINLILLLLVTRAFIKLSIVKK